MFTDIPCANCGGGHHPDTKVSFHCEANIRNRATKLGYRVTKYCGQYMLLDSQNGVVLGENYATIKEIGDYLRDPGLIPWLETHKKNQPWQ
jgi:hypothetical protein